MPSSMFPFIGANDKPLPFPPINLKINELIIFKQNNKLIFHRLIYIHPQYKFYLTKGDNNPHPDPPIKKLQILAKTNQIKHQQQIINFNSIYKTQSTLYLSHLTKIVNQLHKHHLKFILLKGLLLHLYINQQIPQRIFADNDLLIQPQDFPKIKSIFKQLGFKPISKSDTKTSQINFIKPTKPFPIIIDLHLQPAISFTKIPTLAQLTPTQQLTPYLFKHTQIFKYQNTNFPILTNEALLIYLLLHLFHHNFKGYHRFQLISDLIAQKTIDWLKFTQQLTSLNYQNIAYPGLKLIQKLYLPNLSLPYLKPSIASRLFTFYFLHLPLTYFFITQTRHQAARQRLLLTFLLAPTKFSFKLQQLFKPTTVKTLFLLNQNLKN